MEVILQVVVPPSETPRCGNRHVDEQWSCTASSCAVGCLRLWRKPKTSAPFPEQDSHRRSVWQVSVSQSEAPSWEKGGEDDVAPHRQVRTSAVAGTPPQTNERESVVRKGTDVSSTCLAVRLLALCDARGQLKKGSDSVHGALWSKFRQVVHASPRAQDNNCALSNCETAPQSSHTVFFHGGERSTRKDALYLSCLHHLLTSCLDAGLADDVEVSLTSYYEPWGVGDVLAADPASVTPSKSGVTWCALSEVLDISKINAAPASPPILSAKNIPQKHRGSAAIDSDETVAAIKTRRTAAVRDCLCVWFERIDTAAAAWTCRSTSALPLTAAERLAYVESNVVVFALRTRALSVSDHAAGPPPCFTLMLLPAAHHPMSAAHWREWEALGGFISSFPRTSQRRRDASHSAHSAAAATRAAWHAGAVRRSKWLCLLARLHHDSRDDAPTSSEAAVHSFLQRTSPSSMTWVGCVSADWADQRATRTTLSFLSRLSSNAQQRESQDANREDEGGISTCGAPAAVPIAEDELSTPRPVPVAPRQHTRNNLRKSAFCASSVSRKDGEECDEDDVEAATSVRQPSAPSKVLEDNRAHPSALGSTPPSPVEQSFARQPSSPASVPLSSAAQAETAALVASLQLYAATLETEVERLRRRLAQYEGVEQTVTHDEHTPSLNQHRSHHAPLPPLIVAALADLRADVAASPGLTAKLDVLTQRCVEAFDDAGEKCAPRAARTAADTAPPHDSDYVAHLEGKVALYEQRLALMDHYVTPTLARCADEIDHRLHSRIKKR